MKIFKLVIFACLIFISCFLWNKFKPQQNAAIQAGHLNKVEVSVITIKKQKVQLFLELPARVSSYKISEVRPQVSGIIKERKFVEGSLVKEGQQLYQINPKIYQIAFNNAYTSLKTTRARRDRYKNLLQEDIISKQEFDDVTAQLAQAEAEFKLAQNNLTYSKVLAPISGFIGKSNITEGTLVTANQTEILTTITQLDPIYVDMVQPSKDMIKLGNQNGIPVSLVSDDLNYQNIGELKFSEVFVDEGTDSVRLRALFSNPNQELLPGMFVKAKLHLNAIETITVPQRATNRTADGGLMVWVIDDKNIAHARQIKTSKTFEDSWIVEEGLNEGENIIYEGFLKVVEGTEVKPVPINTEATKQPK